MVGIGRAVRAQPPPSPPGDDFLSRVVNAAIATPPLYAAMKVLAKRVLKGSAEKAGVPWEGTRGELMAGPSAAELNTIRAELEDRSLVYPFYYEQAFHAYPEGNLGWLPAAEVEAATAAMALRTFKDPALTPAAAQAQLRGNIIDRINAFRREHGARSVEAALDVGASSGISTRSFADAFPSAAVTGLDLSPYFLAVAELRERQLERAEVEGGDVRAGPVATARVEGRPRIRYIHANAEAAPFPAATFDLVTSCFVVHECRPAPIEAMIVDGARVLRPGGVLAVVDNDPASPTIQNLPPALFTLMKSTEPWSDEYYQFDVEAAFTRAGLTAVRTVAADHRHRVVLGIKPWE